MHVIDTNYLSSLIEFENRKVLGATLQYALSNTLGLKDNYNLALAKVNSYKLHTFDNKLQKYTNQL